MAASIAVSARREVCHLRLVGTILSVIGLVCLAYGVQFHLGVVLFAGFARGWMYFNPVELFGALFVGLAIWAFELSNKLSAATGQSTEPTK